MDPDDFGRHALRDHSLRASEALTEDALDDDPVADQAAPAGRAGSRASGEQRPQHERFGLTIPILLAALGLAAAVIAWRGGVAANAADDANEAGLAAARELTASVITNEGLTARTLEAFMDYERSRRRAEALEAAGLQEQALLERKLATSHWFLVEPDYLDASGQLQPDRQRAALLADDASRADVDPLPHFAIADTEYARIRGLILAGIAIAFALPLLTMAEITAGRLRLAGVLGGSGVFLLGLILAVIAWF